MNILLINTYELGRQPYSLSHLAAVLRSDDFSVQCIDLAVQTDMPETAAFGLVAIHVGMHTGARLAYSLIPRLRTRYPESVFCLFGLYGTVGRDSFRAAGVSAFFAGESEPDVLAFAQSVRSGLKRSENPVRISRDKIAYQLPQRGDLPGLEHYAQLKIGDRDVRRCGFVETTRGCKHTCRHCPVVPVYDGRFRVIPRELVLADIEQQVDRGATHISFGDPDFFNGPGHATAIVGMMHERYPALTFDATIKIEHLLKHGALLKELRQSGCLFITTAVESLNDHVLRRLDKGHSREDFLAAVGLLRECEIAMHPTFIPFNPWEGLEDYRHLLALLAEHELAGDVAPIQLAIRLLIPDGSLLMSLPEIRSVSGAYDADSFGYPWRHPDERMDKLQLQVQERVEKDLAGKIHRRETFRGIWHLVHEALGEETPELRLPNTARPVVELSEQWYCCAEPGDFQLRQLQAI